jgi:predicted nucleotidyltransferase
MKASSGKFVLRIPEALHERLKQQASAAEVSLNQWCNKLLEKGSRLASGIFDQTTILVGSAVLEQEVVEKIITRWQDRITGLVLFGSAAQGMLWETSDVDLLIVLKTELEIQRDLYQEWDDFYRQLSRKPRRVYSPQFVKMPTTADEVGSLWFEVALAGVILYDNDLKITQFLFL